MAKRTKAILKEYTASGAVPTGDQFTELLDSLEDNLAPTTLNIAVGVVTRTQRRHKVDTEVQAATDDLDTINGGVDGEEIILRAVSGSRTVVVKNGTGNINMASDFSLDDATKSIHLWYNGDTSEWNRVNN